MCTLVLLQRPSELLAISGNRNELLSRPARGPMVEKGILAPRDELAHGSWLGLNRHGLFVCVTNRRGAMIDPSRKSRGLLVLEALQARRLRGPARSAGAGTGARDHRAQLRRRRRRARAIGAGGLRPPRAGRGRLAAADDRPRRGAAGERLRACRQHRVRNAVVAAARAPPRGRAGIVDRWPPLHEPGERHLRAHRPATCGVRVAAPS
ncbi:MAG: NRDE family protein [Deltaproteobacteria bacterium]|nr:MAG: NRDE family protein [Deltaproteobacteria bacterium]